MQANSFEHQPFDNSNIIRDRTPGLANSRDSAVDDSVHAVSEPTLFHGYYTSCMEMYADATTVIAYLDSHRDWFKRCAHPMSTEPLGETGYALSIGRFGSFGYEVEPKIGLDLLPQENGVYRIRTMPVPNYEPPGYDVDFQAVLNLVEVDSATALQNLQIDREAASQLPPVMTRVEWELNLLVSLHFPRFIQALPKTLIQTTGDRLLNQIVRQVSRRLTAKVQDDFHNTTQVNPLKKRNGIFR